VKLQRSQLQQRVLCAVNATVCVVARVAGAAVWLTTSDIPVTVIHSTAA